MAASTDVSNEELKTMVEKGYDQIAPQYLAWAGPRPTATRAEYLEKLMALLPAGAKVLELGCGAGVPCTQLMAERGLDVTATDISEAQIQLAKEHVPKATLIKSDMMALEFADGSFDAVVAFYSIFHLPREEQGQLIKKITRWLKEGGYTLFNLSTTGVDTVIDDWMGAKMFSTTLGAEGNHEMLKKDGEGLEFIVNDIFVELVGGFEEKFHWVFASKKKIDA